MSHAYKYLEPELMEEHLSNFLIDSWSYSKVSTFVRHQKVFEMENIFGLKGKRSAGSIAGNGYHTALDYFFSQYKDGILVELPQLEKAAFEEIGSVPANQWKLQKTTPTMELAVQEALKDVSKLLLNFFNEKGLYLDDLEEIEGVELYFNEWLTVNGVDIPLPCHGKIDLVVRMKIKGATKRIIIDHKSKDAYTNEKEAALVTGMQAITYTLGFEAMHPDKPVDEVWFVENKPSKNTNGNAQLQDIRVKMTVDNRKLFELLLYENLREMIAAVKDPDHVYTINPADKFVDMAEVFDFWTRTQICEVDDFNVDEGKKELVAKRLRKIRNSDTSMINPEIIKKFREKAASFIKYDLSMTNMTPQERIEHTLKTFGKMARVAHTFEGYSSNTFLLEVGAGVKVSEIFKYRLDIANALDVENVRISQTLVRHAGKSYLAIEMAKERNGILPFDEGDLIEKRIPLGKDNYGNVIFWNVMNPATPHALVCGGTGSGKTELLKNTIRFANLAAFPQIVVFDTKYVFNSFADSNVVVINEISAIEQMAERLVKHMNKLVATNKFELILVVFDEFADAYDQARSGNDLKIYDDVHVGNYANGLPKFQNKCVGEIKSLQENIRMLLQKGRSCGIRIMQATQRASTKIIDGDAKVNLPVQICLKVAKEVDSRVVLDEAGAEALRGHGDALIKSPEYGDIIRFQSYYKEEEVHA